MFATQYYCLVASLKEYALDADTKGFDARAIVSGILEEVNRGDAREVRLLYGYYDCENIAALRAGRSAHNPLGNFTREELEEEVKAPKRLPSAVGRVLRRIEGAYALGMLCADCPDRIIAARKDAPLLLGYGDGENFIASDVTALLRHTRDIVYMDDGELAIVTCGDRKSVV